MYSSDSSIRTVITKTDTDSSFSSDHFDKRIYNSNLSYMDEEDTFLDGQMISRYEKREDYEDAVESGIVYYYVVKCWNPFKYCDYDDSQQRCMNVVCKSIFVILFIILVSAGIIFMLQYMKFV